MIIDFKKNKHVFSHVVVDEKELDVVNSVKIICITLSSDLKWNVYKKNETIKEANKRLYFLVLLRRAGVSC